MNSASPNVTPAAAPRVGQDLVVGRVGQAGHPQRAGPDVGQPLPGRVGPRIQHRAGHRHLARAAPSRLRSTAKTRPDQAKTATVRSASVA